MYHRCFERDFYQGRTRRNDVQVKSGMTHSILRLPLLLLLPRTQRQTGSPFFPCILAFLQDLRVQQLDSNKEFAGFIECWMHGNVFSMGQMNLDRFVHMINIQFGIDLSVGR